MELMNLKGKKDKQTGDVPYVPEAFKDLEGGTRFTGHDAMIENRRQYIDASNALA